ncbi:MAG: hypothetical protein H6697_07560 [Myxococcales bacterium]|nr:hypothetical protein [Myxococcales bacterium]
MSLSAYFAARTRAVAPSCLLFAAALTLGGCTASTGSGGDGDDASSRDADPSDLGTIDSTDVAPDADAGVGDDAPDAGDAQDAADGADPDAPSDDADRPDAAADAADAGDGLDAGPDAPADVGDDDVACVSGSDGCACGRAGTCDEGLVCAGGLCRAPTSCSELACAPRQLCSLEEARCLTDCEVGYEFDVARRLCVLSGGTSCEDTGPGTIARECRDQGRDCLLVAGVARCGSCSLGRIDFGLDCRVATCGDPATDAASRVRECAAASRTCDVLDGGEGAVCGACVAGTVERPGTRECVSIVTCDELDCAAQARECDPNGGLARCGACVDGFVELRAGEACVATVSCDELDCDVAARECISAEVSVCGSCLGGWVERGGRCECPTTGGDWPQWWRDDDGDGFGDPATAGACAGGVGWVTNGDDCDDADADVYPGARDLPDDAFVDADCDGIDGTLDRLVFVLPGADDAAADGSASAPFGSLEVATTVAVIRSADGLALAGGVHAGPLEVADGIASMAGTTPATRGGDRRKLVRSSHHRRMPLGTRGGAVRYRHRDADGRRACRVASRRRHRRGSVVDRRDGGPVLGSHVCSRRGQRRSRRGGDGRGARSGGRIWRAGCGRRGRWLRRARRRGRPQ